VDALSAGVSDVSQARLGAEIEAAVLRKTLDAQKTVAEGLISLIGTPQPLATEGTLGTRLNTYG
jgi:hypothetical protein